MLSADVPTIRRLQAADLADYKRLRDATLAAFPEAFSSDAGEERARPAESYLPRLGLTRPEGGHFTLGAWLGVRLVGAISCDRDVRAKARHIGHVAGMMVERGAQGHGVGHLLLAAAIAAAHDADGLELLTLSVTADNAAAVRLYQSAGFTRYARLPRAIKLGARYLTKDLMVLELVSGSPAAARSRPPNRG